MNDPRSWTEILIGVPVLGAFAGIVMQQRKQVGALQGELQNERDDCRKDRDEYREEVKAVRAELRETVSLLIDLAARHGANDVADRARSISPPKPIPAVKE